MALVLIIIGVLAAVYGASVYFNGSRVNELTLIYSNKRIETKPHDGVEMLYLGKPISHFIRYEITFFNSGNKVIKPSDFSPEPELAFHFQNMQVISEKAGFASEGSTPHYQIESPEVVVYFEQLEPNQYMSVEVLTGSHDGKLTPPVCTSTLDGDGVIKLHQQVFDETDTHGKYRHLTKHIAVMMLSFVVGATGLLVGVYSKFQDYFSGKSLAFEQQFINVFSVDSLPWFTVSVVSVIALIFSVECLKVIAPKFRRYKFEQLIQNRE